MTHPVIEATGSMAAAAAFLQTHGAWAGPAIGLIAFAESVAGVGLFVPATPLMLAAGALMATMRLDPTWIFGWAVAGAFGGYALSYEAGRRWGRRVGRAWPFRRHTRALARARLFCRRHGAASIVLGRYLGPVQATVPLIAGSLAMTRRRFYPANAVSSLLWPLTLLLPGFLAARAGASAPLDVPTFVAAAVMIALAVILVAKRRTRARAT